MSVVVEVSTRALPVQQQRFAVERPPGLFDIGKEAYVPLLFFLFNYCLPFVSVPGNTNHGRHRVLSVPFPRSPWPVLLNSSLDHGLLKAREEIRHILKRAPLRPARRLGRNSVSTLFFLFRRSPK